MQNCEWVYQISISDGTMRGESMIINSVLRCIVMYCLTEYIMYVMAIMDWVHMACHGGMGAKIENPSKVR